MSRQFQRAKKVSAKPTKKLPRPAPKQNKSVAKKIQDPFIGKIFRYDHATFPKIVAAAERNRHRLEAEHAKRLAAAKKRP